MQELDAHFHRKKIEFVNLFSSIVHVIQKVSYQIQLQIDRQREQALVEFKGFPLEKIKIACLKMEQRRPEFYDKIIGNLHSLLKNQIGQLVINQKTLNINIKAQNTEINAPKTQNPDRNTKILKKSPSNSNHQIETLTHTNNRGVLNKQPDMIKQSDFDSMKINQIVVLPLKQKLQLKNRSLADQEINTTSPIKKQGLKKMNGDMKKQQICQKMDQFFIKEARQMLHKSQSRQRYNSSHQSLKRSTKRFDSSQQKSPLNLNETAQERLFRAKLGEISKLSQSVMQNKTSPIQRFKLQ